MNFLRAILALFSGWAEIVATAIVGGLDRFVSARAVRIEERPDGSSAVSSGETKTVARPLRFEGGQFTTDRAAEQQLADMLRGARIEIRLLASHFLLRTLELPAQASDFLDGIVRAQIDRLTPWTAEAAVFGCSAPLPLGPDRISTTVAVVPRPAIMGYVASALDFKPAAVSVLTDPAEEGRGPRRVYEQKAHGFLSVPSLSRMLSVALAVLGASAAIAFAASFYVGSQIDEERYQLAYQISRLQTARQNASNAQAQAPLRQLERRKYDSPSSTIVLEALSQVLPDHTYVTDLHIAADKVQVAGITQDAPSLIRLIEQSPSFSRASFFAPTTRSPSDPGERFHIEVIVKPLGSQTQ